MTDPFAPPPQEPPPSRRQIVKWAVPVVIALIGIVGLGGYMLYDKFADFTVEGSLEIMDGRCDSAGFRDIRDGAQVEVRNKSGDVLGAGVLRKKAPSSCTYNFSVADVPAGEDLYGVHVGLEHRGTIWGTEDEARNGIRMTLGDK